jgi:hypothetical protein
MSSGTDESQEQWGELRGPAAVYGRLHGIEMRLEHMRDEVEEVGRWADHAACPDISGHLKRALEILEEAQRGVRQARERRPQGS